MDTTLPKHFVFVLMPFSEDFEDVYKAGIKPAVQEAGAYCERLDEQIFHESMLERIYNQISKADLIVADMTGRNPNVFYEVGYAHALGKRVILLTQNGDDIPFDLKHYPHIVYLGKIAQLKDELAKRVSWFLSEDALLTNVPEPHKQLQCYINDKLIEEDQEIELRARYYSSTEGSPRDSLEALFLFSVQNVSNSIVTPNFRIGMIYPENTFFSSSTDGLYRSKEITPLPDGRNLMVVDLPYAQYFPTMTSSKSFKMRTRISNLFDGNKMLVVLRIFLPYGIDDTQMKFVLLDPELQP